MDILHILLVLLNFFYLAENDEECAKYYGDRHLHKMIVEHCQVLSSAWHNVSDQQAVQCPAGLYKKNKARGNHPVVLWATSSIAHYRKVVSVTRALLKERINRGFLKVHKSKAVLDILDNNQPPIECKDWTDPPKCMPVEYHVDENGKPFDVIQSYRLL